MPASFSGKRAVRQIGIEVSIWQAGHMGKYSGLGGDMSRHARWLAGKVGGALGYTVYPNWDAKSFHMARHLAALFSKCSIDCVLDIGANHGQYGTFIRNDVGYSGLLVSVEPVGSSFRQLCFHAEHDPLWLTHQFALGASPGRLPINITQNDDFSSFLTPATSQAPEFAASSSVVGREEVEVQTLDILLASLKEKHSFQNVYLKMDTQGYDLEVLKGANNTLPKIRALQSEMAVVPLYEQMPDYLSALSTLTSLGFCLSMVSPVNSDPRLRMIEFDCVMVKT